MGKNQFIILIGIVLLGAACSFIDMELLSSVENQENSLLATVNANDTQIAILEKTKAGILENEPIPDEVDNQLTTTVEATESQTPSVTLSPSSTDPPPGIVEMRAMETMFCRDGPSQYYEDHTMVLIHQVIPVIARWHENDWILVGIDDPSTRTKCCWVGGERELIGNIINVPIIDYLPDRIDCPLYP